MGRAPAQRPSTPGRRSAMAGLAGELGRTGSGFLQRWAPPLCLALGTEPTFVFWKRELFVFNFKKDQYHTLVKQKDVDSLLLCFLIVRVPVFL